MQTERSPKRSARKLIYSHAYHKKKNEAIRNGFNEKDAKQPANDAGHDACIRLELVNAGT